MSLYNTLKEIYLSLDNGDRRLLAEFKLTVPRFYLLKHIDHHPGIILTELSELMMTDKSNITRLIQGMVIDGMVSKCQHETDGRAVSLFLTKNGKQLLTDADIAHVNFTKERFSFLAKPSNHPLLDKLLSLKRVLETQL